MNCPTSSHSNIHSQAGELTLFTIFSATDHEYRASALSSQLPIVHDAVLYKNVLDARECGGGSVDGGACYYR